MASHCLLLSLAQKGQLQLSRAMLTVIMGNVDALFAAFEASKDKMSSSSRYFTRCIEEKQRPWREQKAELMVKVRAADDATAVICLVDSENARRVDGRKTAKCRIERAGKNVFDVFPVVQLQQPQTKGSEETKVLVCELCGESFSNQMSYNGHRGHCKRRHRERERKRERDVIVLDDSDDEEEWKPKPKAQRSMKTKVKSKATQQPPLKRRKLSLKFKKHKCDLCDFTALAACGLGSHKWRVHGIRGMGRSKGRTPTIVADNK